MYYKAILYNNGTFKIEEVPDKEAFSKIDTIYQFYNFEGEGIFVIRDTERKAKMAIRKYIINEISMLRLDIKKLELKLKNLNK